MVVSPPKSQCIHYSIFTTHSIHETLLRGKTNPDCRHFWKVEWNRCFFKTTLPNIPGLCTRSSIATAISVRSQTGQMGTQLNNQLEKKPTKSLGKFSLGYFDPFLHTCAYMQICTYICHSEKKRLIGRAGDAERDRDQRSADALPRWFADGRADFSGTCFKEHRQNQRQLFQYDLVFKRTELVNPEVTLQCSCLKFGLICKCTKSEISANNKNMKRLSCGQPLRVRDIIQCLMIHFKQRNVITVLYSR